MPYFEDVSSASEKHVKQLAEASQMSGQAPYLLDQWSTVKSQNLPDKTLSDTLPVFSIEDKKMKAEEQAIAAKKLAMSDSSREAIDGGTKDSKDANFPQKRLVDGESMNDRAQHWHDSQEKQNEHNKLVFAEIDSDHNGRLNLSEVENAINNPAADFTKSDRAMLQATADKMNKDLFFYELFGVNPDLIHKYDVTQAEFLEHNRLVF